MTLIHVFRVLGQASFILLGDLIARIANEIIGVIRKSGLLWVNENGYKWIGLCFQVDGYKYKWVRQKDGRVVNWALVDYVIISIHAVQCLLDVIVSRGAGGGIYGRCLVDRK